LSVVKKLLVIGSEGFIGKACCNYFDTAYEISASDILPSSRIKKYFPVSGGNDFKRIFSTEKFDYCINASGSANVGFSFNNTILDRELNVSNIQNILDAIKDTNRECGLINFSSAAVYGNPAHLPVSENAETVPLSPYGKHKLESEKILKEAAQNKFKTCSLRVFSAYGPTLHKQLFWDIFQKSRTGSKISLFGTGDESRDFIFISDLVKAVDCVMNKATFKGEVYNVASGVETTIREAASLFLSFLGDDFSSEFSGQAKQGDPLNWRADISKLISLGFKPMTTLSAGLRQTAHEYVSVQQGNE
jgi:UDP-glucose 4-epimerase